MRYNRGVIDSAIKAARHVAGKDNRPRYIFGTYLGYTIADHAPAFHQRYLKVFPNGDLAELGGLSDLNYDEVGLRDEEK